MPKLFLATMTTINWNEVVKKEARGMDNFDLGEIQSVEAETVITKDRYHLPKNLAERAEGNKILFSINEKEAETYKRA